jgi:hypothetical protein
MLDTISLINETLSELFDAIFGWLEHKNLRTPSREFRMMLQSYRTPNAGMSFTRVCHPQRNRIDCFFQTFRCMRLSPRFTIYRAEAGH